MQINTGTAVVRLTNAATGESITVNISGPGKWIAQADGTFTSEQFGPWLWVGVTFLPGGSQLYLQAGRAVVDFTADFTPVIVSRVGHTIDLCAALS